MDVRWHSMAPRSRRTPNAVSWGFGVDLVTRLLNNSDQVEQLSRAISAPRRVKRRPPSVKRQRRLMPNEVEEMVELYKAGGSTRRLAERYGIHRQTVSGLLRKQGFDTAARTTARKLTDKQQQECADRYKAGESLWELAKRFNVHGATIRRELLLAGVDIRPRPGWKY